MKLLSLQKLREILKYCRQSGDYMLNKTDMCNLLYTFGDDYYIGDNNHYSLESDVKNKVNYRKGWKFR